MSVEKAFWKSGFLIILLVFVSMTACNLSAGENQAINDQQGEGEMQPNNSANQGANNGVQNEPSNADNQSSSAGDEAAAAIHFSSNDPCEIVTQGQAEAAFGQPVESTIPASDATLSSCSYFAIPGEKFITVSVWEGENARRYFINEIAQLSDGCQLTYAYSTDPEEPTPFPDEYALLMDETIPDLFQMDLVKMAECGMESIALPEFSPTASTYYTFIEGGLVGIATDDLFVTFLYFDSAQDKAASLESVLQLVRSVVQ